MTHYLYSGAGNTFVVLDGRELAGAVDIIGLCAKYGTDGLMILHQSKDWDFEMEFFNPDGTGGMMCGNGGRCIVAFADYLGFKPADGKVYHFKAGDGPHTGEILADNGIVKTVRIRMIDVSEFRPELDGWFVDTGTRHFVKFVPEVEGLNMDAEGKRYRWDPVFAPVGANANFVKIEPGRLVVRTFEKGVEGETLACGTGITASAIASYLSGKSPLGAFMAALNPGHAAPYTETSDGRVVVDVRAREDDLQVEFRPNLENGRITAFTSVYLTGPAKMYGKE